MNWLLIINFALIGLLFIGISIPLILRKIPPNRIYGFRVAKTLGNPDIWYRANEYAGKLMAIAGVVITLASVGLGMLGMADSVYAMSMVVVTTVSLIIALIFSFIYLKTL